MFTVDTPKLSGCAAAGHRSSAPQHVLILCLVLAITPAAVWAHPNHDAAGAAVTSLDQPIQFAAAGTSEHAPARLSVTLTDAKLGQPTAARVRITDKEGKPLGLSASPNLPIVDGVRLAVPGSVIGLPEQAIGVMYGQKDMAQGYAFQPDGSFYVKGAFDMPMPAGKFFIEISKGYEYFRLHEGLDFNAGDHLRRDYLLTRWINMPERGWYSADSHIHLRRSPRENPLILDWIAAEDVHVGVLLQMGDYLSTYFAQYGWGKNGRYSMGHSVLLSGQEDPRTPELGHTISFGADQFVRFANDYYSSDQVFDRIHERGGVTGYAHQAMSFHGYRGMTLDVLAGKVDFLELAQFCVPEGPLAVDHYYHFLDLGYRLTALAGSDFPWCGRGRRAGEPVVGPQIGDARFYTYIDKPFSYDRWFSAVQAGQTFATTGPMLEFTVNGRKPGASLDVQPGTTVRITATAHGHDLQVPLQRLQIIGHGNVLAEARAGEPGQDATGLSLELALPIEHGIWLAARTDGGISQHAHTTPIYITVNGDGFHNRANLTAQIGRAESYLQEIRGLLALAESPDGLASSRSRGLESYPASRKRLQQRISDAEKKLEALRRL